MALTQLKTSGIADDAVTTDKLANAINTERTANTAKVSLEADSVTGAKIADDAVGAEHIEQLDADLSFADNVNASFGAGADLTIDHNGTNSYLTNTTGVLFLQSDGGVQIKDTGGNELHLKTVDNGAVELYHDNTLVTNTESYGLKVKHSNDSGAATLKLENNSTHNSQTPRFDIAVDLANGKNGGSIQFIRGNNYQSSAAADSEIVISPTKNDSNTEIVRITQDWFRLHSNCSGIQFNSDTASANALNDYEEGTWTPASNTGNTASSSGTYTKIGRMVYAAFDIDISSNSWNIHATITGLPFSTENADPSANGVARDYQSYDIEDGPIYHLGKNQSQIILYKNNGAALHSSNISGKNLRGVAIYRTA